MKKTKKSEALTIENAPAILEKYKFEKVGKHVDLWRKKDTEVLIVDGVCMVTSGRKSGSIDAIPSLTPYNVDLFTKSIKNA